MPLLIQESMLSSYLRTSCREAAVDLSINWFLLTRHLGIHGPGSTGRSWTTSWAKWTAAGWFFCTNDVNMGNTMGQRGFNGEKQIPNPDMGV
jgi:hypothetical protein